MNKFILIFVLFLGNVLGNPSCPALLPNMINVHLFCHTHDDVGWLKTVDQYYYGSRKTITTVGVQYIIDSVVSSLLRDPNRKFIYVESAFFFRWWSEQDNQMKNDVKTLVNNGQLEFINGGWSMNDEASTHYNAIIDQMTLGLAKLNDTFGPAAFPRIGWQIDPFGHSSEQASLFAQMGMDAMFFGRLDHADKSNRESLKEMEMVWKASNNLAEDAWLFTGALPNQYGAPTGFCFDIRCNDDPIMDDPYLEGYNKDFKVDEFIFEAHREAGNYLSTNNIAMTMGGDFQYMGAHSWFKNLDKLIRYVNERQLNGSDVNVVYSTPSCYLDALHSENLTWPVKSDDFFPYASDRHSYWTGYFTSRPALKGYVRESNNLLQAIKQIAALSGFARGSSFTTLAEAMGVLQHHDGVSGTAKQHVTDNYSKRLSDGAVAAEQLITDGFNVLTNQAQAESFTYCPLLNISSCAYTEDNLSFVVNVYNPIGRLRSHYVRIPVAQALAYTVTDQQGNVLETQIVPLPTPVLNLPGRNSLAQYDLIFYAENLPALGVAQYLVESGSEKSFDSNSLNRREDSDADIVIEKGKLQLTFDAFTKKLQNIGLVTEDGLQDMNVTQDWMWYAGMKGDNIIPETRASGAYIFRPDGDIMAISNVTTIAAEYNGSHVYEVHQEWTSWVTQVVRTYTEKNYVEVEWLVGPIPVDDNIGKEIVTRFDWRDMATNQTFYTDANGREMQKRIIDYRETWDLSLRTEPVSRNYYPVTSTFILQSTNGQGNAALMNDRAQGGTSLSEGQIEIMVHRRLLYDDAKGVGEALNEMAYGVGLVVRGRHILIHSNLSTTECDFGCQQRTVGEELLLHPLLTFSAPSTFNSSGSGTQNPGLSAPLPPNLRLLTLEPWTTSDTWLVRLENFYEENESSLSGTVSFDVETLFTDWSVTDVQELTLGANAFKGDVVRLQWNTVPDSSAEEFAESPGSRASQAVFSFSPMQIRTFIVSVVHN